MTDIIFYTLFAFLIIILAIIQIYLIWKLFKGDDKND